MNGFLSVPANLILCISLSLLFSPKSIALAQGGSATLKKEARAAATIGNINLAVEKYQQALTRNPRDAALGLEIAEFFAKHERYPEAIGLFRDVLQLTPHNEEAEIGLAEACRQVHNLDAARATLQSSRRQHPRSVRVLAELGSLEIEAQSYDAAIAALRAAVALAPTDTRTRNLLGSAYQGKGESAEALAQFDRVLAQDPENQLAHYFRAQIYADMDQNEKALADAEKVVAAKPDYLPGRALQAKVLLRLKKCQQAAETLRPGANALKLDTPSLFLLANAYECAGQGELAKSVREEFAAASEEDRRQAENEVQSKHLYEQANELARQNKFAEALVLLAQALEKNPKNGFAYSQQAKIFFSMREPERARGAIEQAITIQPYQPDFLYVAGVIAASEGKTDEALAAFEKVTQINPKEADAYFEIGKIRMQRGNRKAALAAFRRAADLDPADPEYKRAVAEISAQEESRKRD